MLVHSLSKAERDRVVQNARRADRENDHYYLDLFHDLLRTRTFRQDKDFLHSHPEARYTKSFAKIKSYLFQEILEAQRSLHRRRGEELPADPRIRSLIEESQILRGKQLYEASYERLLEAKQLAEDHHYLELLLEVLKLERTHLGERADHSILDRLRAVIDDIHKVGRKIHAACITMAVRERLFQEFRFQAVPQDEVDDFLNARELELREVEPWLEGSVEATSNFHLARSLICLRRGQQLEAWKEQRIVYRLWRDNPMFASVRPAQHLKLLNNFLTISIQVGASEDFIEAISTLERHPAHTPDERAESEQDSAYIRLQYFLSRADWANAAEIEKAFNKKPNWATIKSRKPRLLAFYICFARLHFVLCEYREVKALLRKFDSERNGKGHEELLLESEVMKFLVMLDERDKPGVKSPTLEMDVPNRVRAIKRILKKLPQPPTYLSAMLNGILKIDGKPLEHQQAEWTEVWTKANAALTDLSHDDSGQMFFAWLQSKAQGRPVSQILRDNFPTFPTDIPTEATAAE